MLSKILVPVEFSGRCLGAARYAEALAAYFHAEMTLAHVVAPLVAYGCPEAMAYSSAGEFIAERVKRAKEQLEGFLAGEPNGTDIERVVLEGDPTNCIVEYAAGQNFDLIVMPTHGYGPFRRLLLGSVTAKVLHDATCPVWTGPHLENAPVCADIRFRKILCAVDLTTASGCVLDCAASFARAFGAELAVVHAIPASNLEVGGFYFDPGWREEMADNARGRMEALIGERHLDASAFVEIDDVPPAVRETACRIQADLVVIGRGHRAGVMGRLRTNAYGIIRESPCPVLAV
jgi:nucleotide-binding universal stress UspA family protein